MTPGHVVGTCLEHPDRPGTPCTRCGTFRCGACLSGGLCPRCLDGNDVARPVREEETVGFGRRAGARIIDLLVGQAVAIFSGLVSGIILVILERSGAIRAGWLERLDHGLGFNIGVGLLASLTGTSLSTTLGGVTPGKAILGMRVVRMDGHRAGLGANLVRELGYFVDALFFGLIGKAAMDGSPHHQRHGDAWANTVVVFSSKTPVYSMNRVFLGLGVGLSAHLAVLVAAFVFGAM